MFSGGFHIYHETIHFFLPLNLATTDECHMNPFGHWQNYNKFIWKIGFWQNKSCASSVTCYCFVGSAPECCSGEMKTKQDVRSALRLFLSPRGFSEMLIAALEIWLLLLLCTNCGKDNNMLYHKAQWVSALNDPKFEHGSSVNFMTYHLLPSSSFSSSLDAISHHHQS